MPQRSPEEVGLASARLPFACNKPFTVFECIAGSELNTAVEHPN